MINPLPFPPSVLRLRRMSHPDTLGMQSSVHPKTRRPQNVGSQHRIQLSQNQAREHFELALVSWRGRIDHLRIVLESVDEADVSAVVAEAGTEGEWLTLFRRGFGRGV